VPDHPHLGAPNSNSSVLRGSNPGYLDVNPKCRYYVKCQDTDENLKEPGVEPATSDVLVEKDWGPNHWCDLLINLPERPAVLSQFTLHSGIYVCGITAHNNPLDGSPHACSRYGYHGSPHSSVLLGSNLGYLDVSRSKVSLPADGNVTEPGVEQATWWLNYSEPCEGQIPDSSSTRKNH